MAKTSPKAVIEVFQRKPESESAFDAVRDLLTRSKKWPELLRQYNTAIKHAKPKRCEFLLFEAGVIAETRLQNLDKAAHFYEQSFLKLKQNSKALRALRALEESRKNHKGILHALQLQLKTPQDKKQKARLYVEIAELYENSLKDTYKAIESYRLALDEDPSRKETLVKAENLCRQKKRWNELVRIYKKLAIKFKGTRDAGFYHFCAALVFDEQLRDPRNAAVAFSFALKNGIADLKKLERIRSFAIANKKDDLQIQVLAIGSRKNRSRSDRHRMTLDLADLYSKKLQDPSSLKKAEEEIQKVLGENPRSRKALTLLEKIYDKRDPGPEAKISFLQHQMANLELNDQERSAIFAELGSLREQSKDFEGSTAAYRGVLGVNPNDVGARLGLARIARINEDWQEFNLLLEVLNKELKSDNKDQEKHFLELQKQRAFLYQTPRPNPELEQQALKLYLDGVPGDIPTLERLMVLADGAGEQAQWGQLLEQQAKLCPNKDKQLELYQRLAHFREEALGDSLGAAEAWEFIDQNGGERKEALETLERLYQSTDHQNHLASTLRRQAEYFTDGKLKAIALRKLGCLLRDKLDSPRQAIHVLRDAWAIDPEADNVIQILEDLLSTEEKDGDDLDKAWVLREISRHISEYQRKLAIRKELVTAYLAKDRDKEALALLDDVLSQDPTDEEAFEQLVTVLEHQDKLNEIWFYFKKSLLADSEKVLGISRRLNLLYDEKLDKDDKGPLLELWKHTVEILPGNEEATRAYVNVARSLKGPEYRVALEALIDIADPSEERILQIELGRLHREGGQLEKAKLCFQRAHEIDPKDQDALDPLRSVLALLSKHEELLVLLQDASESLKIEYQSNPSDELADRIRRLVLDAAELADEKLNNPTKSLSLLEPCHDQFTNVEVLERLIALYRKSSRTQALSDALGQFVEYCDNNEQRCLVLLEKAQLDRELLERPRDALDSYNKAIEKDPKNGDLWLARASIHENLGEWREALSDLERGGEYSGAVKSGLAAIERRRGLIYRDQLKDDENAENCFKQARSADPDGLDNHNLLIDFYERRALYPQLQEALSAAADHAEDQDLRASLLARRGEVLARFLGKVKAAMKEVEKALELRPGDLPLMDLKIRLLRHAERPEELVGVLEERRNAFFSLADDEQRIKRGFLLREEALLRGWELSDFEKGRELLSEAVSLVPERLEWVEDALLLERRSRNWKRRLNLLKRAADRVRSVDPKRRAGYLIEAGVLCFQQLEDVERARRYFNAALASDSEAFEALHWLQIMAVEKKDIPELLGSLTREYELREGREKDRLALRIGELQENAGDLQKARVWFEKASESGSCRALRELNQVLDSLGEPEALFESTLRLAQAEESNQRRRSVLLRLAERLVELEDTKRASQAYRSVLESFPGDIRALRGLAGLLDPAEETDELISFIEKEVEAGVGPARFVELQLRLGQLRWREKNDGEAGKAHFLKILERDFRDEAALSALKQLYIESHDWSSLAKLYEEIAIDANLAPEKEEAFRQAALIYHHHEPQDILKAKDLYFKVLEFGDPECVAIDALPPILKDDGSIEEKRLLMSLTAQIVPGSARAKGALMELGTECYESKDLEKARLYWTKALGWTAGDVLADEGRLSAVEEEALELILKLERSEKNWKSVRDYLALKVLGSPKEEARRESMVERGTLLKTELKDDIGALEIFEAVFQSFPQDENAISSLRELYQGLGRGGDLSRLLSRAAEHSATEDKRCEFLLEQVEVDEGRGERHGAMECLRQLARYRPEDIELRRRLAKLQQDCGEDVRLLITLDELVELLEGEDRLDVYLQKSVILERLERRAEACELLEKVLEEWTKRENPKARELVERLRSLAEEAGDDRLILLTRETDLQWLLLKARQDKTNDHQKEVEELTSRVSRLHVATDNLNMAESWLERGLEVYPESKALFLSLRTVVEVSGEELRFVEVVERRCELCDAAEEAELRGELAELLEQEGEDSVRAFAQWEKILEICPGSFAAMRSLQRLAWTLNRRGRALEMCERELEYLERLGPVPWNKAPGGKEGKLDNGPLLQKAFEERGQKAQQYDLKSLRGDTSGYPLSELEALVACLCYGHKVGATDEDDSSRPVLPERFGDYVSRIYRKAAIVAWDLDELDRAAKYLERAYFLVPKDEMARLHLAEVHEFRKDWTALAAILRARWSDIHHASERVSLGLRLADLEEKRGENFAALSVLQSIWQESDGDPVILNRMQSLQNTLEDYEGLLKTLRWQAERCRDLDQQHAFVLERGRVLEDKLNRPEDAAVEYETALQLRAGDIESLGRLTKIFEAAENYERLVDLLLRSARLSDSGDQSQHLFERASFLTWRQLKDGARARSYIESALRFGPGSPELLDLWVEIERDSPGSESLAKALKAQSRLLSDEERRPRLLEIARLELERDPEECAALVEELLEIIEEGCEDASVALELRVQARRRGSSKGALIEALKSRQLDTRLSEEDRLKDLEEWAALALELGPNYRSSGAEALEAKLELVPGDLKTLFSLIELFKENPSKRLRWLERALACELESDKEEELLELVTDLATRVLHDAARAVPAYQRLLEIHPENQQALSGLLQILEREGRHGDALETIEKELGLFEEQDPLQDWLVQLRLRKARIFEEVVFDLDAAYEAYKSVFELFKEAAESPLYTTVFTAYEGFLRRRGRFESLVGLLEERAERAEEDGEEDEARRLWQEQAMIYEGKLEDSEGTCHCFERALELDGRDESALIGIQRPLRVLGRWKRLEEVQEVAIPLEEDLERRAWLSYQRGLILEEELNRLDDAMESYELSLYVDPFHLGAIRRLARIYQSQDNYDELARIWTLEVKAVEDKTQKGVVLSRLGDLYQDHLDELGSAEDCYREAIKLFPRLLDAYDGLSKLLKADERFGSVAELLADQLKVVNDPRRQRALRIERAALLEDRLEALDSAVDVWSELFEADAGDHRALAGLLRCKRQLEDWSGMAELVERALAQSDGILGEESYDWLIEAARALQLIDDEGSRERAIDLAQRAFAIAKHRSEAVELLMGLCHEDEMEPLIDVYQSHAIAISDKTEALRYFEQSGRLALKWEAKDAAKASFEKLLEIDDGHLEALEELETIAQSEEDWGTVTRCLEKRRTLNRMGRAGECYLRLGKVYERMGEVLFAVSAYETGLDEVKKSHKEAFVQRLRPCLEDLERWDDLANILKTGAE
ncbi:MAG: tetratricopeptide repeat protein, partial [Planctomycetota bacterium]|nr:tetratricopeptide repeat protein [Planctomycetota bacterium]